MSFVHMKSRLLALGPWIRIREFPTRISGVAEKERSVSLFSDHGALADCACSRILFCFRDLLA